jgi:hypothetical protein
MAFRDSLDSFNSRISERVLKSFWSDVPTGPVPVERVIVNYRRRLALLLPPPSARTNGAPLVRAEGGGSKTKQNRLVVASLSFHRHRAGGDVKKAILKHALRLSQTLSQSNAHLAHDSIGKYKPKIFEISETVLTQSRKER